MAPAFTEKGMYALNYPASAENTLNLTYYPLLWQAGWRGLHEGRRRRVRQQGGACRRSPSSPTWPQAGALDPEALTTNVPLEQTAVAQGKVACTWNNAVNEVVPFWGEENVKVMAPLTEKESVAYGTVGSLSVLKAPRRRTLRRSSSEYATGADVVEPYLKAAGYFSALSTTAPLYADDPLLGEVEKYVPDTTVGELNASSRALMGVLAPEIQAALLGDKTPEAALKGAATAAAPLIKK